MASGQSTTININYFLHAGDYISVCYYRNGGMHYQAFDKDKLWKYVVTNKLHVCDEESGEAWEKEEFFKDCQLIIEGIIKQQWQNLV
jgi:hypothetical protein